MDLLLIIFIIVLVLAFAGGFALKFLWILAVVALIALVIRFVMLRR